MVRAKMERPRMRPRFEVELDVPGDAVLASIRRHLAAPEATVDGSVLKTQAELTTHAAQHHFWSPYLSVEVTREEDGRWMLRGRFAPEPNVWILFMGIYGILGMFGVAGLMYGVSQWIVKEPPWALIGVPISLGLIAFTYGAAFIGQGLGAEEMYTLRSFVDDAVKGAQTARIPVTDAQG
ncbi:MAG: hypothetical protein U0326_18525 [Polyangiales bacterium]